MEVFQVGVESSEPPEGVPCQSGTRRRADNAGTVSDVSARGLQAKMGARQWKSKANQSLLNGLDEEGKRWDGHRHNRLSGYDSHCTVGFLYMLSSNL